jgi:5-methylcytosine-specific restriction endonuclease McrA
MIDAARKTHGTVHRNGVPLNHPVLVLNRLWQAVNVCTVRRAISLLCCGHAQVVDEDEGNFAAYGFSDWCEVPVRNGDPMIHSVSISVRCPAIIVLTVFDRLPMKEVRFSRSHVFARDHHMCQYCRNRHDRKTLTIDHVVPRHRGGKTVWTNVVCCCVDCNRVKGNRTPDEAGMRLITEPRKPRWQPFLEIQFTKSYDDRWHHFLDVSSWKVEMGV